MGFFSKIKGDKSNKEEYEDEEDLFYEEEELDISINVGTSGVRSASKYREKSKRHDYEKIRSEVDEEMVVRFLEILDVVDTKMQFFTQVEDEGTPLITLVALGVTSEESVNAYQTLRSRGIDTYTADISKTQRVDDDYANEISMYVREYPRLKEVGIGEVPEPLTASELYKVENKQVIGLEMEIRNLERKLRERVEFEPEEEELDFSEKVKEEVLDISDIFGGMEEEEVELDDEDKLTQEVYSDWNSKFEHLKSSMAQEEEEEEELLSEEDKEGSKEEGSRGAVRSVHKVRKHKKKEREIYVLSESFELEDDLKGYKVIFIDQPEDLMLFSASKENLMVITRAIPYQLVEMFLEWVESVSERGIKLRAVTLKGLEIEHALIEDVVELTQESLDNYYEEYKLSRYIGSGVSTFFDIEKSLEGIDI